MARIGFLCILFILLLLLLIIHISVINEDFPLPISREIHEGENHTDEAVTRCFDPPLSDNPIFSLAAVASQDPTSPPNASCTTGASANPPALLASPCKDPAFTDQLLPKRRRIIHVILFGFEVTILLSNFSWKGIGVPPHEDNLLRWTPLRSTWGRRQIWSTTTFLSRRPTPIKETRNPFFGRD